MGGAVGGSSRDGGGGRAPAGWTLTGATAVVTGTAEKFNLTHTRPAEGGGESPTPVPSGSVSPSASATPTPGSPGVSTSGAAGGGSLPVTGAATVSTAVVGAAMVAGGVALLAVRRRRHEAHAFVAGDTDGDGGRG